MTLAEIEAKLAEMKIKAGTWKPEQPGVELPAGDIFTKEAEILGKIASLLEGELTKDRDRLADLHIALARAKLGGGR